MTESEVFKTIPGLEIREKIGGGGMGAVFKAYQVALDRVVALKTVRSEYLTSEGLRLFQSEARLLAKCNHPSIVRILEFHPEHAVPYFLMEYVDGVPLDQALHGRPWKERVTLFKEVVATIASAHEFGVVHGDLKPANILVDRRGKPHILDFGLGRLTRADKPREGATEPYGGTPAFLAPELIEGRSPPSTLSDIYALGVTLYLLLTGVLPYATMDHARWGNAKLPLEHDPDIPEPLQRICLKAMERDPQDRYQTAEQLERDLERFLEGKPIFSRPTRYYQELEGRVSNHLTELQMWEQEGFISRRERDLVAKPYAGLLTPDSPWLSELRKILTGPLLIRVGAWFFLLSAVLWPVFYWSRLDRFSRVASAGAPTLLMAILGTIYLILRNRRYALACLGSFTLLLLVFEVVLLSEFKWLRYPQRPEWELWGHRIYGPAAPRPGPNIERVPRRDSAENDELEQGPARRGQPDRGVPPPGAMEGPWLERHLDSLERTEFILSNSQIFSAALTVTLCIALLMTLLRSGFFAPWLVVALFLLFIATMLLVGDKERLLNNKVAWVCLHFVGFSVGLLLLGALLEWVTTVRVGKPFYRTALGILVVAGVLLAGFGTEEWFEEVWRFDNETFNFWLMAYSVPFFVAAWLAERYGSEGQRTLSGFLYLLVPIFLLLPLHLLFWHGPKLFTIGAREVQLYEALYLAACVLLLVFGRWLNLETFLIAGLWGLAVWVFRVTARHFDDYLSWPLGVGISGGVLIALGVWRSWSSEPQPEDYRRRAKKPAPPEIPPTTTDPARAETIGLP